MLLLINACPWFKPSNKLLNAEVKIQEQLDKLIYG